jgi:beta-1,4-N-acetylglucosaminyltransferase
MEVLFFKQLGDKKMKICLVFAQGGHCTQTLQLLDAFEGHKIFFATYYGPRDKELGIIAPTYFTKNIDTSYWRMFIASIWAFKILTNERPDVIISLGSEIAIPFFYLGKLLSIKTIFIETWSRLDNLSFTARLVYPVANVFLVQWPQLLKLCGPKAQYQGSVI